MTDDTFDAQAAEAAASAPQPAAGTIAAYKPTEAALAELATKYKDVAYDLTTVKGDKAARGARKELTSLRTALETKRKQLKAPALEYSRRIDSEAARIANAIVALEAPIDEQIKADEQRREDERQARANAEQRRIETIQNALAGLRAIPPEAYRPETTVAQLDAHIKLVAEFAIDPAQFDEFTQQAVTAQAATLATLRELRAAALARQAEAERNAAERAELERHRAAEAERQRIEREKQEAEQKAERDRLEAQRIAQQRVAEEQAARQRELDEQFAEAERKADADRERAQAIVAANPPLAAVAERLVEAAKSDSVAARERDNFTVDARAQREVDEARERLADAGRRDGEDAERLAKAAPRLVDACNGLLGLLRLIATRPDVSEELRAVIDTNHRVIEAAQAVAEAMGEASAETAIAKARATTTYFAADGTLMNADGTRNIFDDVDE